MHKKKDRASVTGDMNYYQMVRYSFGYGAVGTAVLASIDPLCAGLGLSTILLYAGPYTNLKRRHWLNTQIGAIVGALPPIIGAAAKGGFTGMISTESLCVAGLLLFWQFPHFYALNAKNNIEYIRGHYHMLASQSSLRGARWSFY